MVEPASASSFTLFDGIVGAVSTTTVNQLPDQMSRMVVHIPTAVSQPLAPSSSVPTQTPQVNKRLDLH